jgi:dihydroorotate dehydrogenase (NAD+) catalytic subunit
MKEMMKVTINGVEFKNPVIAASGTFGFGEEFNNFYDVGILGGISSKGLTINPKQGNEGIRVYETPSGMMNSVGLQNPGIDAFIENELPKMRKLGTNVIANIGGGCLEDYEAAVSKIDNSAVDMIELNISCPNVKHGGMAFGIKSKVAYDVVKEIKAITKKPLMVKLSPNAEDIVDMALKCQEAGADSISLINTLKGMAIDVYKRKPVFNNITAGLSGPAVKPIALRMVYEVAKAVDIPVIGLGGISSGKDAIEFMMAGASAIQIGTINFVNPMAGKEIIEEMESFLKEQGIKDINEIVGII